MLLVVPVSAGMLAPQLRSRHEISSPHAVPSHLHPQQHHRFFDPGNSDHSPVLLNKAATPHDSPHQFICFYSKPSSRRPHLIPLRSPFSDDHITSNSRLQRRPSPPTHPLPFTTRPPTLCRSPPETLQTLQSISDLTFIACRSVFRLQASQSQPRVA